MIVEKKETFGIGGSVSFIQDAIKRSNVKAEEIFTGESTFDTRKELNRSTKVVPKEVIEEIEKEGMSIERIESLGVPVYKYKTQITLHGVFEGLTNTRVGIGNYKNLMLNENKTLGIKYNAIDAGKKRLIAKAVRYDYSTTKSEGDKSYSTSSDSRGFSLYKYRTSQDAVEIRKLAMELKKDGEKIPNDLFIGAKYINIYNIYGMYYAELSIHLKAIREENVWKFIDIITDGRINEKTLVELVEEDAEKRRLADIEYKKTQEKEKEEALVKIKELAEKSPYQKATALPRAEEYVLAFVQSNYMGTEIKTYSVFKNKTGRKVVDIKTSKDWDAIPKHIDSNSRNNKLVDERLEKKLKDGCERGIYYLVYEKQKVSSLYEKPAPVHKTSASTEKKELVKPTMGNILIDTPNYKLEKSQHTKTQADIFILSLKPRVSKEDFNKINQNVKNIRGYWSGFVSGFILKSAISEAEVAQLLKGTALENNTSIEVKAEINNTEFSPIPEVNEASKEAVAEIVSHTDMPVEKAIEEIKEGVHLEEHHRETLEKVASGEMGVNEAIVDTVVTHIKEEVENKNNLVEIGKEIKFPELDASVVVKQLSPNDPFYKSGDRYDAVVSYPESLGEQGNYSENNNYKTIPTKMELLKLVKDTIGLEIDNLLEDSYLSGRDENILDALMKINKNLINNSHLKEGDVTEFGKVEQTPVRNLIVDGHAIEEYGHLEVNNPVANNRVFIVHKDNTPVTEFNNLTKEEASEKYEEYLNNPNSEIVTWDLAVYNEYGKLSGREGIKMKIMNTSEPIEKMTFNKFLSKVKAKDYKESGVPYTLYALQYENGEVITKGLDVTQKEANLDINVLRHAVNEGNYMLGEAPEDFKRKVISILPNSWETFNFYIKKIKEAIESGKITVDEANDRLLVEGFELPASVVNELGYQKREHNEKRNIWIPKMTVSRLEKLLSKSSVTKEDFEDLQDYKQFLLEDKQSAIEKGFYIELGVSQREKAYVLKNKFWLVNIDSKLKEYLDSNKNGSRNANVHENMNTHTNNKNIDFNNLIVYHGSQNPNIEFRDGIAYFTDNKKTAESFADRSFMGESLLAGEVPTLYMAKLKIKNPKIFTTESDYDKYFQDTSMWAGFKLEGYDGMAYLPEDGGDNYYAVFSPDQIELINNDVHENVNFKNSEHPIELLTSDEAKEMSKGFFSKIKIAHDKLISGEYVAYVLEEELTNLFNEWFEAVVCRYPLMLTKWLEAESLVFKKGEGILLNGFISLEKTLPNIPQFFNSLMQYNVGKEKLIGVYDLIPESLKYSKKLPSQIAFDLNPADKDLINIVKPFVAEDELRPNLNGVCFDSAGIAVTDAHKLLFIEGKVKKEGVYGIGKVAKKNSEIIDKDRRQYKKVGDYYILNKDVRYPNYGAVIPQKFSGIITIDRPTVERIVKALHTFKNTYFYNYNTGGCYISLYTHDVNEVLVTQFNIDFLIPMFEVWLKIGFDKLQITNNTGVKNSSIVLMIAPDLLRFSQLKGSGSLLMAMMVGDSVASSYYVNPNEMYLDINTGNVYTAGIDDDLFYEQNLAHKKEVDGNKINKEISDYELLIDFVSAELLEDPNNKDYKDYLDLIKDTVVDLKEELKTFRNGGEVLRNNNLSKFNKESVKSIIKNEGILYAIKDYMNEGAIVESEILLRTYWKTCQKKIQDLETYLKLKGYVPAILIHNESGFAILSDIEGEYTEIPSKDLPVPAQEYIDKINDLLIKIIKHVGLTEDDFNANKFKNGGAMPSCGCQHSKENFKNGGEMKVEKKIGVGSVVLVNNKYYNNARAEVITDRGNEWEVTVGIDVVDVLKENVSFAPTKIDTLFKEGHTIHDDKVQDINNRVFYRYYPADSQNPFEVSFNDENKYGYGIYFLCNKYYYKEKFPDSRLVTIKPNISNPLIFINHKGHIPNYEYTNALAIAMGNSEAKSRDEFTRKMVENGYDSLVVVEPRGIYFILFSNDPSLYKVQGDIDVKHHQNKAIEEISTTVNKAISDIVVDSNSAFNGLTVEEAEYLYSTFKNTLVKNENKFIFVSINDNRIVPLIKKRYVDLDWILDSTIDIPVGNSEYYGLTKLGLEFMDAVQNRIESRLVKA